MDRAREPWESRKRPGGAAVVVASYRRGRRASRAGAMVVVAAIALAGDVPVAVLAVGLVLLCERGHLARPDPSRPAASGRRGARGARRESV